MSEAVSVGLPRSPEVTFQTIAPSQRVAARVAGVLYLVTTVTGIFAESVARARFIVRGDAAQTVRNIAASERLFRLGIVSNLITFTACVILTVALYVVLSPVGRNVALLAAFWRLAEAPVFAVVALADLAALRLLRGSDFLRPIGDQQLQALARLLVDMHADAYLVGLVFFGLGSTVFAYLWFKSGYIPRALAAWGVLSSVVVVVATLATIVFPGVAKLAGVQYMPIFIFEVGLGLWLALRGIREHVIR